MLTECNGDDVRAQIVTEKDIQSLLADIDDSLVPVEFASNISPEQVLLWIDSQGFHELDKHYTGTAIVGRRLEAMSPPAAEAPAPAEAEVRRWLPMREWLYCARGSTARGSTAR